MSIEQYHITHIIIMKKIVLQAVADRKNKTRNNQVGAKC